MCSPIRLVGYDEHMPELTAEQKQAGGMQGDPPGTFRRVGTRENRMYAYASDQTVHDFYFTADDNAPAVWEAQADAHQTIGATCLIQLTRVDF